MFKDNNKVVFALLLIFVAMLVMMLYVNGKAKAEESTAYIICQPNDVVVVREGPRKTSLATGELLPGTAITLDGKEKNGYCHCVYMHNETGDGWVSATYVVSDRPIPVNREAVVISKGRLAARRSINGKRSRWLKPGDIIMVYFFTEEWCVTNKGYVKTQYLEFD